MVFLISYQIFDLLRRGPCDRRSTNLTNGKESVTSSDSTMVRFLCYRSSDWSDENHFWIFFQTRSFALNTGEALGAGGGVSA